MPHDMIMEMSVEIPKKVKAIHHVFIDPTDKPPATTEMEQGTDSYSLKHMLDLLFYSFYVLKQ